MSPEFRRCVRLTLCLFVALYLSLIALAFAIAAWGRGD